MTLCESLALLGPSNRLASNVAEAVDRVLQIARSLCRGEDDFYFYAFCAEEAERAWTRALMEIAKGERDWRRL